MQAIRNAVRVAGMWLIAAATFPTFASAQLQAQDSTTRTESQTEARFDSTHVAKTFFTRRDAIYTGAAIAATAAISHFDVRISHWAQSPSVQDGQSRHDLVDALTHINETPLTIGAILTYGVGRLGRWKAVTDIGLHMTEALVLTDVTSELIRGPIGRARPRISPDDAFVFSFGKGFTDFGYRAFPSLHAASAFAAAASLTEEIHLRKPGAAWVFGPILYGAALIPGATRIYLNQHWMSDVASGAFVGTLFGIKVVHYAHTHKQSKLDRVLMGAMLVPDGHGGTYVATSFTP
jgi:membrane-associated phospholipid phosphatase